MDFNHSEDRRMLADALGRYLARQYPFDIRQGIATDPAGWPEQSWKQMAELGIVGALLPETSGGFGGSGFDIAVVFEQLGKALVVEPFLGAMMAGHVLAGAGGFEPIVENLVTGEARLTLAHQEAEVSSDPSDLKTVAVEAGGNWLLTGQKAVIPQLEAFDQVIVSARVASSASSGVGLFLVDRSTSGVMTAGYQLADGGRGGDLVMQSAPARPLTLDGEGLLEFAVATGLVALAWEAVGVMDVIKSATLEYLRTRHQFGVPIGKFQALQHRMATLALEIEQSRSAAINASDALGSDRRSRERAASAAKFTIGRVGTLVAEEAIQMHGGIGMTWELPLPHYAKRLIMIGHQLGDEDHHLQRFIDLGKAG